MKMIPQTLTALKKIRQFRESRQTCVYFLILKNEVVYVGMTTQLSTRVGTHRGYGKKFDRVLYIVCTDESAPKIERALIRHLRPVLNGSRVGKVGPLDRAVLELLGFQLS